MSQPTFVTHYMVRRPKAGNQGDSRPFEDRVRHGANAAVDTRSSSPSRLRYPSTVRRAS
ncbi:conserved hypothetical protein [Luteimonas sp. 9C]|nr:conserved hypothetical protein [Luteimonas sp. 9C]